MRYRLVLALIAALALLAFVAGCNIFGWSSEETPKSLIDEGREHMRDGEYAAAEALFAQAMAEDPKDADARYYHAKAVMHGSGFNPLDLANIIEDNPDSPGSLLPFFGPSWPNARADSLFRTARTVYSDLRPIYRGEATGEIKREDIDFDLGIVAVIRGLLMFRDTNFDGAITSADYEFSIVRFGTSESGGFTFTNLVGYLSNGAASPRAAGPSLALAPTPIDPVLIVAFNNLVDNIAPTIAEAWDILVLIGTDGLGYDLEEVQDFLLEVIATAHNYKIEIGVDNDSDGAVDEEIVNAADDDGDGLYDEDSNGTWELFE